MTRILFVAHTAKMGGPANSLLKLLKYLPAVHTPTVVTPGPGGLVDNLTRIGIDHFYNSLQIRSLPALVHSIYRGRYD